MTKHCNFQKKKKNHQVRLLVLAFKTILAIFLGLRVLFAYGRFPVWPVFEGGWKNTKRNRLEVFSIGSQL